MQPIERHTSLLEAARSRLRYNRYIRRASSHLIHESLVHVRVRLRFVFFQFEESIYAQNEYKRACRTNVVCLTNDEIIN